MKQSQDILKWKKKLQDREKQYVINGKIIFSNDHLIITNNHYFLKSYFRFKTSN